MQFDAYKKLMKKRLEKKNEMESTQFSTMVSLLSTGSCYSYKTIVIIVQKINDNYNEIAIFAYLWRLILQFKEFKFRF